MLYSERIRNTVACRTHSKFMIPLKFTLGRPFNIVFDWICLEHVFGTLVAVEVEDRNLETLKFDDRSSRKIDKFAEISRIYSSLLMRK